MAEWVAADPRVCGSNPTKDTMKHASISQSDIITQFPWWLATLHWDLFIRETSSALVTLIERHPPLQCRTDGQSFEDTGD